MSESFPPVDGPSSSRPAEIPLEAEAPDAPPLPGDSRRRRRTRTFPTLSFKEACVWPEGLVRFGAGQPMRRMTLLEKLAKSPTSGPTRALITASNQYGLTTGGYNAEQVELTPAGRDAVDASAAVRARATARFELAIGSIAPFNALYNKYTGNRLPAVEALQDSAVQAGVHEELAKECVETFLANAREVGIIRAIAGTEHFVALDDALAALPSGDESDVAGGDAEDETGVSDDEAFAASASTTVARGQSVTSRDLSEVCFVVSPIGNEDSVERKHADLVLNHLISPAMDTLGLQTVRADKIARPGMITAQIIEHLVRAKLVVADLSFANPNVYYELAVRHAARKPAVQLTRSTDKLPFDVGQFRTVSMDMTDLYTFVPQLELIRTEITRQARAAISEQDEVESPISRFYPGFWDELSSQ